MGNNYDFSEVLANSDHIISEVEKLYRTGEIDFGQAIKFYYDTEAKEVEAYDYTMCSLPFFCEYNPRIFRMNFSNMREFILNEIDTMLSDFT
jgi:hypothetical protein